MNQDRLDQRLYALLLATDRALPAPSIPPVRVAALRARRASRAAQRHFLAGLAAAIALFAFLSQPGSVPVSRNLPSADSDALEIASLEREADLIRLAALTELGRRDRLQASRRSDVNTAAQNAAALRAAAAEKAAFLMYCEADRLSKHQETLDAARDRYAAVAELFPKTIWARMAEAQIAPATPIEKG